MTRIVLSVLARYEFHRLKLMVFLQSIARCPSDADMNNISGFRFVNKLEFVIFVIGCHLKDLL